MQAARDFDAQKLGLTEKETALFDFALKANGDPHGIDKSDLATLRDHAVSDAEIVEILEVASLGNSLNLFCDSLQIEPDAFLTEYMSSDDA